jgi:ribosome-binding factor A
MSRRVDRINGLLRQEISEFIAREIKDPRLEGVISITLVRTSNDLRNAQVYVSVLGDDATKKEALAGMRSAATYLRRGLRDRLALRYVPFLRFELDESIETADRLLQLLDRVQTDDTSDAPDQTQSASLGPVSNTPPGR